VDRISQKLWVKQKDFKGIKNKLGNKLPKNIQEARKGFSFLDISLYLYNNCNLYKNRDKTRQIQIKSSLELALKSL
jgi:hypothetical protein